MSYKINYRTDNVVDVNVNGVDFMVDKEKGILYEIKNSRRPVDVEIPNVLPSGHHIRFLASDKCSSNDRERRMVWGRFNKITISDDILVGCEAFFGAKVKEVVWNNCSCIPRYCFYKSEIVKISNITSVKAMMKGAFMCCNLKEMIWPDGANIIPQDCFRQSLIESLSNIEHVKKIEDCAFKSSRIKTLSWPTACKNIPDGCFETSDIEEVNNIKDVEAIEKHAFSATHLRSLDLSEASNIYLAPGSLAFLSNECKVTLPYYINEEDLANALKHQT